MGIFLKVSEASVKFGSLFGSELEVPVFLQNPFGNDLLLGWGQVFDLFQDFCRTHGRNLL